MRTRFVPFLIACLACLAGPAAAGEPATVRFGVCLSLTGEFAEAGKKALAGVKLRLDDFNSRADENGYVLEMVVRDAGSDAAVAAAIVREMGEAEKVPAIIGPLSTNLMLGMREEAARLGVVLISPSVTSPRIGRDGDWAFRVLFDDAFQGVALARFLRERQDIVRAAAIVNERLGYSVSVFDAFKEKFEMLGGEIVAEERYNWVARDDDSHDFVPALEAVVAARPEIVLLPVNSVEVSTIIRASTMAGLKARFCGGDTWQHENVLLSSGNNIEDAYFISGVDFTSGSPAMKRFLHLYDHSNDPDAQLMSVLGYDALSLLIEGLKNGRDGAAIREGLYKVRDFELATGVITIDPRRGSEKTAFIHRVDKAEDGFVATVIDEIRP